MNSVREKTSASNEPLCKEEKAEFLIAQIAQIALIAISFFPLDSSARSTLVEILMKLKNRVCNMLPNLEAKNSFLIQLGSCMIFVYGSS
jgi:hypothetical protein